MNHILEKSKNLPQKPGVYLLKNAKGEVLYIGKAKNLKKRVKTYFLKNVSAGPRLEILKSQIVDIDYVIVSSELESLILENNLIKQYRPRFNVRLRDDKNYQFIKIDYSTEIPQIYLVRKIPHSEHSDAICRFGLPNKYFGPYTSSLAVKQTLKLLNRIFHLCRNKKIGTGPCFAYHLGRCPGVCIGKISPKAYRESLKPMEEFLNHRQKEVTRELKKQMLAAAGSRRFEKAANLRDKLKSLELLWEKQKIVSPHKLSQDYFSLYLAGNLAVINLFVVRDGKLIHQENFEVPKIQDVPATEILNSFLKQYYTDASDIPREIILKTPIPEQTTLAKWLKVKISNPRRGKKLELLNLGEENARDYYEKSIASFESVLAKLQKILNLPTVPKRIEAYDISNIQGFLPVGSMVVFLDGQPAKSQYRKFLIRGSSPDQLNLKATPNDYAMMKEMLIRRFARAQIGSKFQTAWPLPDLIIIDGGKGQLNAALKAAQIANRKSPRRIPPRRNLRGRQIAIIGLAKRLEEIFVPGKKEPIVLSPNSPVLKLLQRIRDEAHRFAITFYRRRHEKELGRSRLEEISGIGPLTKKRLLQKFGTISAIKAASLERLAWEIGFALAKKVKENL